MKSNSSKASRWGWDRPGGGWARARCVRALGADAEVQVKRMVRSGSGERCGAGYPTAAAAMTSQLSAQSAMADSTGSRARPREVNR